MKNKIAIIDYGLCNLLNVYNAIPHVGGDADIIDNPKVFWQF